jgi:hypothetical protein
MNSPEAWAGFGWVVAIWDQVAITLLAASAPVIEAMNVASKSLALGISSAWLILLVIRSADVGLYRAVAGGMIMWVCLAFGLSETEQKLPSGGTIKVAWSQKLGLNLTMGVHKIFHNVLGQVIPSQTVAGQIIPAQSALDEAVGRSADLYAGSDLARLIRDYNASCAPSPSEIAGPANAAKAEALHAVGLLGGGGLGIPEDEINTIAQIDRAGDGLMNFFKGAFGDMEKNGGFFSYFNGGSARIGLRQAYDLRTIQQRREAGVAALKNAGPFMGDRYSLPTEQHWSAIFSGDPESTPSYLPITMIPKQTSSAIAVNGQEVTGTAFWPSSCAEAYQIAQLGAEQAYRAMKKTAGSVAGGQAVSAETSSLAAVGAWQRFLGQSLQKTAGLKSGDAEVAGGLLAAFQGVKNFFGWLDLQTLLPLYVMGAAWMFWLAVVATPCFLILAPFGGMKVLQTWFRMLILPVISMILVHVLVITMSLSLAALSLLQAGSASGWQGGGADYDALRGSLSTMSALMLGLITWGASQLSGLCVGAMSGALTNATATASGTVGALSRIPSMMIAGGRLAKIGQTGGSAAEKAARRTAADSARGASSGSGASRGGLLSPIRVVMQNFNPPASGRSNRPGGGKTSLKRQSLNPSQPASTQHQKPPGQPGA